jgi:Tfp pilus assembly protein PilN
VSAETVYEPADEPLQGAVRSRRRRSPRRAAAVVLLAVVLAALAGGALYFSSTSRSNRSAALEWRAHALRSDRLVAARTHQLNTRSAALNRTAAKLNRSQADVRRLEARQRDLANEKARVEDQRGAMLVQTTQLTQLANEQMICSDELGQLLSDFANDDYGAVSAEVPGVAADCQTARSDFDAFQGQVGAG